MIDDDHGWREECCKNVAHRIHFWMLEIRRTDVFDNGLKGLRDTRARTRIAYRIDRLALGNPGDVKPVGGGVSELRIDYGPGSTSVSPAEATSSSSFSVAGTRAARIAISSGPERSPTPCKDER